jgi:hypothetical protein
MNHTTSTMFGLTLHDAPVMLPLLVILTPVVVILFAWYLHAVAESGRRHDAERTAPVVGDIDPTDIIAPYVVTSLATPVDEAPAAPAVPTVFGPWADHAATCQCNICR